MSAPTAIYKQELAYHMGNVFVSAPFDISMRNYFEDFLYEASKVHEFSRCFFYIEISTKKLERTFVYYNQIQKRHVIEQFIRRNQVKHVMSISLDLGHMLIVDRMLQKIKDIFSAKLTGQDYYEFCVHARLIGLKAPSFSSDLYKLKIDGVGVKLYSQLLDQELPGLKTERPKPSLSASIVVTHAKKP